MRICAIVGCSNGTYRLKKWKETICSQHSKLHEVCSCLPPFELYPFPTVNNDPQARQQWIKAVNRKNPKTGKNWLPSGDDRICSKHFVDTKPTVRFPYPTLNLGYKEESVTPKRSVPKRRKNICHSYQAKKVKKEEKDQEIVDSGSESASIEQVTEPEQRSEPDVDSKVDESAEFSSVSHDHCYTSLKGEMCDSCADKRNTIRQLQARIQQLESQNKKLLEKTEKKEKINFVDICLKSDKKVKTYTGIPNKSVFEALLNHVSSKAKSIRYWCGSMKVLSSKVPRKFKKTPEKSGPQRKLTVKEELTLLLLKLRMAIKND